MKKIELDVYSTKTQFSVHISGDIKYSGMRAEGARQVELHNTTYNAFPVNGEFRNISNDMKALCAILCFYPSFPDEPYEVDFGFDISGAMSNALVRPYLTPNANYSSSSAPSNNPGNDTLISYGGGFDSLAAHCLFPNQTLVHQTPISESGQHIHDIVNDILPELDTEYRIVKDNMRQLYSVWGLPLWVSVFVPSILYAPKVIISGSELTGSYLEGGKRYFPRYNNLWYQVFRSAGVPVAATSFLSEIGNALVCYRSGVLDKAAYCQFIAHKDCGGCSKCLRRRMIKDAVSQKWSHTSSFEFSDEILKFLQTKPLYYGDIFAYCMRALPQSDCPEELARIDLESFTELDFLSKFYEKSFSHFDFPERLELIARRSLKGLGIGEMNKSDCKNLESYRQENTGSA